MNRDDSQVCLSELAGFARGRLAADRHPDDHHRFTPFGCPVCGVVPLALTVQHHTGSKKSNFKGVIFARCSECQVEKRVFSFTGAHRTFLREEKPACQCGSAHFLVAMCERIEGDQGLPGFFDEGVIVGACARCGRNRTLAYTD